MTYISLFANAELKEGAPIKGRAPTTPDASKVKAFGTGLQKEGLNTDMDMVEFTVDVTEAGPGELMVKLDRPGKDGHVDMNPQGEGVIICTYKPDVAGQYIITIQWSGEQVPGSPFFVDVTAGLNVFKAYGPGLVDQGLVEAQQTEFWVDLAGAGQGSVSFTIKGPKGPIRDKWLRVEQTDKGFHVMYTPQFPGKYEVELLFAGRHIAESPYELHIAGIPVDAKKCHAEGDGITGKGVEIGKPCSFLVYTKGAGRAELGILVEHQLENVALDCQQKDVDVFECSYVPRKPGEYEILIQYGDNDIPGSPFKIEVDSPTDPSKCRVAGFGLFPLSVSTPASFTVITKGAGKGEVEVAIHGPDGLLGYSCKTHPYTYDYTYEATSPGLYTVDVKFAGEHVASSPYSVAVTDTSKVHITGPGMKGEFLPINEPLEYFVDARGAGPGKLDCTIHRPMGYNGFGGNDPKVIDNDDGTFKIVYTPNAVGRLKMNCNFADQAIPSTPIKLQIFDASKVRAFGEGLKDGNVAGSLTSFKVDTKGGGEGNLKVDIQGPGQTQVSLKEEVNHTMVCLYSPPEAGEYDISVLWCNRDIPRSPFHVSVNPTVDSNAVVCFGEGLQSGCVFADSWAEFTLDTRKAGKGEPRVEVVGPYGTCDCQQTSQADGLYTIRYNVETAGEHFVYVSFAGQPIPSSPFQIGALWNTDISKVKIFGSGLQGGMINEWAEFSVDLSRAGSGNLKVLVEGPSQPEMTMEGEDLVKVKILPKEPGEYKVSVKFSEIHIPGSPFSMTFKAPTDATKVKVNPPGLLEEEAVCVNQQIMFAVDTSDAGDGDLDVAVYGPFGCNRNVAVRRIQDGYTIRYTPDQPGKYEMAMQFAGTEVPTSPFKFGVFDPSEVVLSGECLSEESVKMGEEICLTADMSKAGQGRIEISVRGPATVEVTSERKYDNTNVFKFTPSKPGDYKASIMINGKHIHGSPFTISVKGADVIDGSAACKAYGPGLSASLLANQETYFNVDIIGARGGKLYCKIIGPDGAEIPFDIQAIDASRYKVVYTPLVGGTQSVSLSYAMGSLISGGPFPVAVCNPPAVRVCGKGIEKGIVNKMMEFTVDTCKAGVGNLDISVDGPANIKADIINNKNGTHLVKYVASKAGIYKFWIKFGGVKIRENAFAVLIENKEADASKCILKGIEVPGSFVVDASLAGGNGVLEVCAVGAFIPARNVSVTHNGDYTFNIKYDIPDPGETWISVKWHGEHVPGSPFTVHT